MWKCASGTIRATFHKSVSQSITVLSTKVPQQDVNCLLKLTPFLIERINRYYGFYKNSCGNFSKEKDKEGPREKKTSFLGGFNNNVVDALGWGGVIIIGYYLIQPFTRKRLFTYYDSADGQPFPTLTGYQRTLQHLLSVGLKPFCCVLPEGKAAKSRKNNEQFIQATLKSLSPEVNFSSLEKAHQKVLGVLSNWMGTHYMQSGKHKEALKYFKEAAEEQDPAGMFNLGICHEKGLGTSQNFETAAELYQKAADLGHATAMYNLGVFYAQGLGGVEPNEDHARELFKVAASLGQRDAKRALKMEEKLPENISPPQSGLIKEEGLDISVGQFICDTLLQSSSLNSPEYCNFYVGGVESSTFDSFEYPEKKLSSTVDSDSGILDLSPPNDSDAFYNFIPQV